MHGDYRELSSRRPGGGGEAGARPRSRPSEAPTGDGGGQEIAVAQPWLEEFLSGDQDGLESTGESGRLPPGAVLLSRFKECLVFSAHFVLRRTRSPAS